MDNKNLILIVCLVVVVFLAGAFVLLQNQKMMGLQEKNDRLILNNPKVEIVEGQNVETFQYFDGTMPLDCCAEDWQRVRLDTIPGGGDERVCLFVHPRNNATVNLTYENIKLKKILSFTSAISDVVVTGSNAPVYMDVYVNDNLLQRITQEDRAGWFTTNIDTEQYANKLADVKLVISTDNNLQRHFCFDALVAE